MGILIGAIVLFILSIILFGTDFGTDSFSFKLRIFFAVPLTAVVLFFGLWTTMDESEIAVVTRLGEVQSVESAPGWHWKGILEKYNKYTLEVQEIRYDDEENLGIEVYSNDSQPVYAKLTIQWTILPEKAEYIYENFGGSVDVVRDRLSSLVVERTKSTLSGFTAEELIEQRASLSSYIKALIIAQIENNNLPVNVVDVYLTNFEFSQAYDDAVEAKMIAEQDKLKAETEKEIAIIQAEQQLETTKLEAEAALAEALGQANALLAVAQAEASALSAKVVDVARTLGFVILENDVYGIDGIEVIGTEYVIDMSGHTQDELNIIFSYIEYIAYLQTWDGELPSVIAGDDSATILIPSS